MSPLLAMKVLDYLDQAKELREVQRSTTRPANPVAALKLAQAELDFDRAGASMGDVRAVLEAVVNGLPSPAAAPT